MEENRYWRKIVTKAIKAELAKRGLNYVELVEKLNAINVPINVNDLRGRISRGNFSAALFIQCLRAIGVKHFTLEDSYFEP